MDKDSAFLSKTNAPIWGNVVPSIDDIINHQTAAAMFYSADDNTRKYLSRTGCDHVCLYEGLLFAQVLGDSARNGFDVLYFKDDIKNYNSLVSTTPLSNLKSQINMKQSIMMLFKKLIGTKVFNVKLTKNSINTKQMNFYGFCSKQMNGAITLMGINFSNMRGKFNLKLSSQLNQNAVVLQYLMTISDGQILLNNEPFDGQSIIPSYKFKKFTKNSIIFTLPPYSIGFWTVKNAKISECLNLDYTEMEMEADVQETSSSADLLLQQLLKKVFESQAGDQSTQRVKRQIGSNMQFLPKLDLDFPFKFPTSSPNQKSLKDVLFNKNTDIYRLNSPNSPSEKDLLKSSENAALPEGDVYLLINDGGEYPEVAVEKPSNDYITDEAVNVLNRKSNGKRRKPSVRKVTTTPAPVSVEQDEHDFYTPYDYDESKTFKSSKQSSKKTPKVEIKEDGELWEMEKPIHTPNMRKNDPMKSASSNVELKVMKELEPTYRQSKAALMAAKKKWNRNQIMELLKDADLEEVDKSKFKSTDDFEIIDLTENTASTEYHEEDYLDEDDDDFFKSEENFHHSRNRRDISENEIRKYNYVDEDISLPYDLEDNIMFPSHKYVSYFKTSTSTTSTTQHPKEQTTEATPKSKTYKAIDFFSQSLADVVTGVHSQLLGWFNIFVDPQFEEEKTLA